MRFRNQFWCMPTLSFFFIFSKIIFVELHYSLGTSLTATPNCFARNNSTASKGASFAMHLATRRRITSPTAIGLMLFLFFNAVNVALHKPGATKFWSSPLLAKFTNLVREFTLRLDWSAIEQLIAWCSVYILDGPAAVKFEKHWSCKRTFASSNWQASLLWSSIGYRISFFPGCSFSRSMRVFCCRVLFPPMIKSLPPTALSLKTKCSRSGGKRFHCAVAFLLASLKPLRTDGQLNHPISIAQIYSSLSFPAAACFLPPLLEARKTFANCEKLLPVLNTIWIWDAILYDWRYNPGPWHTKLHGDIYSKSKKYFYCN